ncbi:hypothetical protein J4402_05285 [Candidatus Pacearchaeota archaeon]|nr:hypothetical protein [Candidatus Pacearchaeota archaeon]
MAKRKAVKKKSSRNLIITLLKIIWFVIKIPYHIVRGIYLLTKKTSEKIEVMRSNKKRESIKPEYSEFELIKSLNGNYKKWEDNLFKAESKIGIIIGARGSGKTAFGVKLLENIYAKSQKRCYAIGFHKENFPSWINVVEDISEIKNNSFVLVDEGGIFFSSRESMSKANKFLSDLILISRHKNLNIIFITQNSSNLDVNILRQADYLVLKPSSLLQKEFERKIIQKIYDDSAEDFNKLKSTKGLTFIYSSEFKGFISNKLPSFWGIGISKAFK